MGEVDDAQQAKDHRQSQAQHGIKGTVHQAQQKLAQKRLNRYAEYIHGVGQKQGNSVRTKARPVRTRGKRLAIYFQSLHLVSALVVQASSPLMVSTTL